MGVCTDIQTIQHESDEFFLHNSSKKGILLIHGFTGCPGNMREMGDYLFAKGYTVLGICLSGHNTTLRDFIQYGYNDWINDAILGYNKLAKYCDQIDVAGLSMGGCLSLIIASRFNVRKVIAMSTPLKTQNKFAPFSKFLSLFVKYIGWDGKIGYPDIDYRQKDKSYSYTYSYIPISKVSDLNKIMKIAKKSLPQITCPALIVEAGDDKSIDKSSIRTILSNVGSKEKQHLFLEGSNHACTYGEKRAELFKAAFDFLEK